MDSARPAPRPTGANASKIAPGDFVNPLRGIVPAQQPKKPPVGWPFRLLVEAAGIEPASASPPL